VAESVTGAIRVTAPARRAEFLAVYVSAVRDVLKDHQLAAGHPDCAKVACTCHRWIGERKDWPEHVVDILMAGD
jgi:hypothetical protein